MVHAGRHACMDAWMHAGTEQAASQAHVRARTHTCTCTGNAVVQLLVRICMCVCTCACKLALKHAGQCNTSMPGSRGGMSLHAAWGDSAAPPLPGLPHERRSTSLPVDYTISPL
mmetsp:Transcript_36703/g.108246  ORF Transcript_36703/g.108246 Transcript_36703/m.108246 type:complete len:114 (-) Transcript_36703:1278-1619(-)